MSPRDLFPFDLNKDTLPAATSCEGVALGVFGIARFHSLVHLKERFRTSYVTDVTPSRFFISHASPEGRARNRHCSTKFCFVFRKRSLPNFTLNVEHHCSNVVHTLTLLRPPSLSPSPSVSPSVPIG